MTRQEFERHVDTYLLEIRAKLMRGWDQWRDRAANFSPERIAQEISDEAVDVLGWAFWIWVQSQGVVSRHTPPPLPPYRP